MKTQFLRKLFVISFVAIFGMAGCKKDAVPDLNRTAASDVSDASASTAGIINQLAGSYSVTGTRTLYIGDASDSVVNLVVDLAPYSPKTMVATDDRTLVCDYADLGYGGGIPLGFQYVIKFNEKMRTFDVQPNYQMLALIVPGSWIIYEKRFNPRKKQFHFKTGYSNSSSGYDRITDETLTWVSQ